MMTAGDVLVDLLIEFDVFVFAIWEISALFRTGSGTLAQSDETLHRAKHRVKMNKLNEWLVMYHLKCCVTTHQLRIVVTASTLKLRYMQNQRILNWNTTVNMSRLDL